MKLLCVFALLFLPMVATANSVGGYSLGMSNAEAAKIGLRDCKREGGFTVCSGNFTPTSKVISNALAFDEKSKRLVQLKVYMDYAPNELEMAEREMQLPPCAKAVDGTTPMLKGRWHTCHYPLGIRSVKSQNFVGPGQARHYVAVELEWEAGADKRFIAEERKRQK